MFSEILLGGAMTLFIALLGWSDKIKEVQTQTKELELQFLQKAPVKYPEFKQLVGSNKQKNREVSKNFLLALSTLSKIASKKKGSKDISIVREISDLEKNLTLLKKCVRQKYTTTIKLTMSLFGSGIISLTLEYFIPQSLAELFILLTCILPVIFLGKVFFILINVHKMEVRVQEILESLDAELED